MSVCDACSTVVAGINCATRVAKWCELCTITSLFLLINFRQTIYFARPRSTNTVDDTFFMGWGKVFPQNSAIELLDHIVPLVHALWLYDGALLWNISNWVTFCNDIGCFAHVTKHVTHITQHSVTCVTVFYFMFYVFIYFCWSFIC